MAADRFRERAARMDCVLIDRLGASINTDRIKEPTFTVRSADAAKVKRGAFITIDLPAVDGGGRYKMVRPEPDGAGMVDLTLGADSERSDDIK